MSSIKERADIAQSDKWRLSDLYASSGDWEADFALARREIEDMASVEAGLSETRESILSALNAASALNRRLSTLYCYARMSRDEDSRVAKAQAMADRAQTLAVRAEAAVSFLRPSLLAMPEALLSACAADPAFEKHTRTLSLILRERPHTLPKEQEALLAEAQEIGGAPSTVFTMLTEADMSFPQIAGEDGEMIDVSEARFLTLLVSRDRRVRKDAYETVMGAYGKLGNTFASLYAASIKNDCFNAHARRFPSAIEASLFANEIPTAVYGALLEAIEARLPALNRYLSIKQRALSLPEMHLYDLYVDTTPDFSLALPYAEGYDLVLSAVAPLGEAYAEVVRAAKKQGWVDVYENAGKHHGAYSWGTYDAHPYVLMNYEDTLDSASTLAHELGHAMHSYLSSQAQPFEKSDYTLFAAEVASTVNEILLSCHLLEKHKEPAARQSIIGALLEHFRTTVFRQSLFAMFEREAHAMQERGEALTRDALCALYYQINEKFYGASCVVDDPVRNEWMRIPHFYRAFYVYQYATGFCAAVSIARGILSGREGALSGYLAFLGAGGSLPPIEALRLAGVDMETPAPVQDALGWFEELLAMFEGLINA